MIGLIFAVLAFPNLMFAHAQIQRSTPAAESELTNAPASIQITYTEGINGDLSNASLSTDAGAAVAVKLSTDGDKTLVITPKAALKDGIYKVKWQVLSVDTHVTEGSFRFAVGEKLEAVRPHETISLDGDAGSSAVGTPGAASTSTGTAIPKEGGKRTTANSNQGSSKTSSTPSSSSFNSKKGNTAESKESTSAAGGKEGVKTDKNTSSVPSPASAVDSSSFTPKSSTPISTTKDALTAPKSVSERANATSGLEGGDQKDGGKDKDKTRPTMKSVAVATSSSVAGKSTSSATKMDHDMSGMDMGDMDKDHMDHMHHAMGSTGQAIDWNKFLRVIEVLLVSVIGGLWYFRSFLWDRSLGHPVLHRVFAVGTDRVVYLAGCIVLVLTGLGHLLQIGIQLNASQSLDAAAWHNAGVLLRSTVIGTVAWVRPILLLVLFCITFLNERSTGLRLGLQAAILSGLALTFAFTGHSWATESMRTLSMLTDVLHLVMAAVWLGGLAGLSLVAWRLPQDSSKITSVQQLLRRFSNLALPLVIAVTVTGLLLAILRIGSWQALFQSGYGQTLLWKIGFFLLALVLAGVQRQVVLPYLQRQQDKPEANMLRVWQWSIRLELAMAILVFIIAGILSTTAPPAL
ncbi:hypothetical protein BVG16_18040 [Paenibacillus selenitireducens]|uniref:Copper resistance protein CopC n=2 Tax=Paenibacillus selenitireducens TaxID=1324314 RepID=A0A1T2X8A3_9BACL|nr:hypothetical protein BVG16_18040 [Paenibacillus selenitireducens]